MLYTIINMWCSKLRRNRVGKGGLGKGRAFPNGELDRKGGNSDQDQVLFIG